MAAGSLYFTSAPITPSDVTLKFSKILVFVEVFKKGYRNKGIWAWRNYCLVWWCRAKHWRSPTTKQILLELTNFKLGGGESYE